MTKPKMPVSLTEPWLPFDLGADIDVAILSDLHIPYHCQTSMASAIKYCKRRKPDAILLNGDAADFYSISRFQQNPKKRDFAKEVTLIQEGLAYIRGEFPKARIIFKEGNHEERWQHWLWNRAPEICNFPQMTLENWLDVSKFGVEMVGDQRPIMLGSLPVMHGHELGKSGVAAPVNPARGLFLRTGASMLIGHGHRTSHHCEPNWEHKEISTWSTGCLCGLNPEYARINKWNHGFAFVQVDPHGDYHVDNLRIGRDGKVW